MDLILGLPDDIALQCLIRVPYQDFSSVSAVCRSWKTVLQLPHFSNHRKLSGFSQRVIVMAQARFDPKRNQGLKKYSGKPIIRLTLCEPRTGKWSESPPMPGYSDGLPIFCQLASVGYNLVLMGGWDPATWMASPFVFIYNFVTGAWRRGSNMPGRPRSFFACASDSNRRVFVAGGHDDDKNALKSALSYDVENDEWTRLADMAGERDECKGIFQRGKFHIIGGYHTEKQGRFERSAHVFDVDKWRWDKVDEEFQKVGSCPRSCVDVGDGRMYMCHSDKVIALGDGDGDGSSQAIIALPTELSSSMYLVPWDGNLLVMGAPRFGEASVAYLLDLKSCTWTKVEKPLEFSGHVQSNCCLEI